MFLYQGLRNDFKEAMDKVDQQYLEEMVKLQGEDVPNRAYDIKFEDDGSTIDDIIEMSSGMGQGDDELDNKVIVRYIKVFVLFILLFVCLFVCLFVWMVFPQRES